MSTPKHTPRWKIKHEIYSSLDPVMEVPVDHVLTVIGLGDDTYDIPGMSDELKKHVVSCLQACEGINPAAVPGLIKALELALDCAKQCHFTDENILVFQDALKLAKGE